MAAPRLSVSFDPRSAERLERLAKDDQGKAEVIRDALALEDMYRDATSAGGRLLVQRPDGTLAEIVRPSGPWGSVGRAAPDVVGGYTMPPGINGDRDRRELLSQILALLYSCVGSAQRAEATDETQHAVHQLVIASAALAAGEADAFLTLAAGGLEGPACIHLRAIGELAIRIVLCREHRDLALELYQSWAPSWEKLVRKQIPFVELESELQRSLKDFRAIEESNRFKQAKKAIVERDHLLNDIEWTMWSKRAHGDIYALVQVSVNLAARSEDVRSPIIKEVPFGVMGNVLLTRAIGFSLMVAKHVIEEFGILVPASVLQECIGKYAAIQERDAQVHAAQMAVKNVTFPYSFAARMGENFCTDREHVLVENAAACLGGINGEVHELKNGIFTGVFWSYEKKGDGRIYSTQHTGSPYLGKTRSELDNR
jgi:hypothetical protein